MTVTENVKLFWKLVPRAGRRTAINLMKQGMPLPVAALVVTTLSEILAIPESERAALFKDSHQGG